VLRRHIPDSQSSSFRVRSLTCSMDVAFACLLALLTSCGGGSGSTSAPSRSYTVSANIVGLADVTGLSLQDNSGDTLAASSSGLTAFSTAVPSGGNYSVTILSQPTGHTCAMQNGSGKVDDSNVVVMVVCPWHVGYATSTQGILAYYLDESTGATYPLAGNPFHAGSNPTAIAVDPAAQYLYVTDQDDNTISAFTIDPTDGSLSPVAGSPYAAEGTVSGALAIDAQGRFVYVANLGSDTIAGFSIDASSGSLTPVAGSPFAAGISLQTSTHPYLAVSRTDFVYVAAPGGSGAYIAGFSLDPTTGALSQIAGSPFSVDGPSAPPLFPCVATAFLIDPKARHFYTGFDCPEGTDTGYFVTAAIDPVTGVLTVASTPANPYPSPIIGSLAADSTGAFLYNGDDGADYVDVLAGPSAGTRYEVGGAPTLAGIDPSNRFLYAPAINQAGQVINLNSPYSIDPTTGVLTPFMGGTNTTINNGAPVAFSNTP